MAEGIDPQELSNDLLLHELKHLHATRFDTLCHGGSEALHNHTQRMTALEAEYLRRYPERQIDPNRTREGARQR
jgi:hypothetical protein